MTHEFMAYDTRFTGGVWVAVGDVNGDGYADIITGADSGGGPPLPFVDVRGVCEHRRLAAQASLLRPCSPSAHLVLAPALLVGRSLKLAGTYEIACEEYGAQGLNPLALWDMHWVKELDDEGFIDALIQDMT